MDTTLSNVGLDQILVQVKHVEQGVTRHLDGIRTNPDAGASEWTCLQRHVLANGLIEIGRRPAQHSRIARFGAKRVTDLTRDVVEAPNTMRRFFCERRRSYCNGDPEPAGEQLARVTWCRWTCCSGEEQGSSQRLRRPVRGELSSFLLYYLENSGSINRSVSRAPAKLPARAP